MSLTVDPSIRAISYYPKAALYGADAGWTLLSSNENPYPPSPAVIESIVNAVFDINRYPESEGELKLLLSRKYGLKPENFVIGNGSNEIIEASLRSMRSPGRDGVVTASPSFAFYPIASSIYGFKPIMVPLDSLHINLRHVADRLDDSTRVVILCNPNNPTGTIFDEAALLRFLKSLPPEVLVVVDEAYAEFSDSRKFPRSLKYINDYPLLVLRTFSKAYGLAGLRVGYGVGEESLISFIERTKQPFSVNMMALTAAKAAITDERHLNKVLDDIRREKTYLFDALSILGFDPVPSEANFVLVKVGPQAEALTKRLFEKRIVIRWLGAYGLTDYVRVTVGTIDENRRLIETLKRVKD